MYYLWYIIIYIVLYIIISRLVVYNKKKLFYIDYFCLYYYISHVKKIYNLIYTLYILCMATNILPTDKMMVVHKQASLITM